MSTYQTRKPSVLDASRTQTNHSTVLNTTDISLNSTNLESYKKALHSIVRRLNKTPSSSSKNTIKKLEYKMNQTHQPLYNTNILTSSHSSKKHYMSPSSAAKNHSMANRSQSGERSPYKVLKDGGDRSLQESYMRKESLTSNFMNSVSINKVDKQENTMTEELYEEKLMKGDSVYVQDNTLNSTLLQDVNATKLETEGDQRLRELVHKYQLRDSAYRQELNQVKKAHEAMKGQMVELEREMDKVNKSKDMEKRYISKLEEENSQLKERLQQETIEKKSLTAMLAENKESQYLKIIEDLKTQVSTLTSEKKLIEHLLKNALTQKEATPTATAGISKDNIKDERKISTGILTTLESSSLAINSCKYSNIKERVKTTPYSKKTAVTETYNDENDYATHAHYQTMNSSFGTMPLKFDKEAVSLKEVKQPQQQQSNSSVNFENLKQFLNERINTQADEQPSEIMDDDGDEAFPNKVFHPKLNQKSLKERINMSQFKLDLTRISKSRKAE